MVIINKQMIEQISWMVEQDKEYPNQYWSVGVAPNEEEMYKAEFKKMGWVCMGSAPVSWSKEPRVGLTFKNRSAAAQ